VLGLLAALLLGLVAVDRFEPLATLSADYRTGTGERLTVVLPDRSVLHLDTRSAVDLAFDGSRRAIVLRAGEIAIETAHGDAAEQRPFVVLTPEGRLRALGTRFVVRIDERRARVSVQQGAVALHPGDGPVEAVVQAGQSRWLAESGSTPAASRGFDEDGWVDGVIAGRNIRMADLLAELGRYRHGVVLCDPAVAELRVSGVFHVRDSDRALQFLAQTQPISVRLRTRYWVSVGPPA